MTNFITKNFSQIIISLLTLSALTACPGKSNNDVTTTQVVNGYVNCTNCGGLMNGPEFLVTESTEYNNLFVLRLGFGGAASSYGYNPSQYQGPVAVSRGELIVQSVIAQGYCVIPVGSYSMGTLISGQYSNGIVSNLKLVATGPVSLVINVNSAQIASPNNRDQYGMLLPQQRLFSSQTVIESMNGQLCQIPLTIR